MTTFGERLRTLRRAAGLSQTELAGDGISPSYVSLLESDRRRPSPGVAALLAAKLGCSTSQLLDGEPSERERRIQLELAYAELALQHDGAADAVARLEALLAEPDLLASSRTEVSLLLARAYELAGNLAEAVATLTPLFEEAKAGNLGASVTRVATHLCFCHLEAGDLSRAVTIGEEALEACRRQGLSQTDDYFMLAATILVTYAERGDELHAAVWARQLIREAEAAGSRRGQAGLYWNAALLAERDGRLDEAVHLSRQALAHMGELGESRDLARLKLAAVMVFLVTEPPLLEEAREVLDRSRDDLVRLGGELDVVEWEHLRSRVALLSGDLPLAVDLARSAVGRVPADAGSQQLSLAHQALGDALKAQGLHEEAVEHYVIAADLRAMETPSRGSALAWRDLAERLWSAEKHESAVRAYRMALEAAGVRDRARPVLEAIAATPVEKSDRPALEVVSAAPVEKKPVEKSTVRDELTDVSDVR